MISVRLQYLLNRYASHACNDQELEELAWLIEETSDEILKADLRVVWDHYANDRDLSEDKSRQVLESILAFGSRTKPERDGLSDNASKGKKKLVWLSMAAAVLVILAISYKLVVLKQRGPAPEITEHPLGQDASPAKAKAVLTLAGGDVVLLDSAHAGQLARQGSSRIVKVSNGLVAYHTSGGRGGRSHAEPVQYNSLSTPRGGQYQLILPDGSRVWLNAASSIRFPTVFSGKERRVDITGEVYFEVARQPGIPFKVTAGNMEVEVLGTGFNVNAYKDREAISTTLVSGHIRVRAREQLQLLDPGEQAQIDRQGRLKVIKDANIEEATAWKKGLFYFQNDDLQTIMTELSRWYDVDVIYSGKDTGRRFSGQIYRSLNLSQVLQVLHLGNIRFKIEGQRVIVFI